MTHVGRFVIVATKCFMVFVAPFVITNSPLSCQIRATPWIALQIKVSTNELDQFYSAAGGCRQGKTISPTAAPKDKCPIAGNSKNNALAPCRNRLRLPSSL